MSQNFILRKFLTSSSSRVGSLVKAVSFSTSVVAGASSSNILFFTTSASSSSSLPLDTSKSLLISPEQLASLRFASSKSKSKNKKAGGAAKKSKKQEKGEEEQEEENQVVVESSTPTNASSSSSSASGSSSDTKTSQQQQQQQQQQEQTATGGGETPKPKVERPENPFSNKADAITPMKSGVWQGSARGKVGGITKSTATLATEARDNKLYTMQQYMELEEKRANKGALERIQDKMDHPGWPLMALAFISVGVLCVVISMRLRRERFKFDPTMRQVKSIDIEGGASIGGPFSLVDTEGKRWTNEDFKGKWLWIYFGFTNCPDVCPQEMAKMTKTITQLDKRVGRDYWQPLFISIDAKRDTPQAIKEYLSAFHPRILGLTGTAEEVEKAAREFRVYFAVPDEFDEEMPDYLIDHSIIMYIMNPEGKFEDYTTKEFTWYESLSKLMRRMADYEKKKSETSGDANLRVANIDSLSPDQDAAPFKTDRSKTVAEVEREKRNAGITANSPHGTDPALQRDGSELFDSWKNPNRKADFYKDLKSEKGNTQKAAADKKELEELEKRGKQQQAAK